MKINNHRDTYSPARSQKHNTYGLNDYYWFPEDFETHKDMFSAEKYELITDQFSADDSGFFSMIGAQVKNEIKSFNKLGSLINTESAKNKPKEKTIAQILYDVPSIKILEMQPLGDLTQTWENIKDTINTMNHVVDIVLNSDNRLAILKEAFDPNKLKEEILNRTQSPWVEGEDSDFVGIPEFFYNQLIGGHYLNKYTLPFFNNPVYLNAQGAAGWSTETLRSRFLGDMLSGLAGKIPGIGSVNIAARPSFSLEGNSPEADVVNVEFNLYNYNIDALGSNLKFLHSLTAGAFWVQHQFVQQPSCLYDIEVPGRFRYYYCKANIKVEFVGKVRSLDRDLVVDNTSYINEYYLNSEANINAIRKCPDSYKVTIEFTSLLPNNLNTYLFYLRGDIGKVASSGGESKGMTKTLTDAMEQRLRDAPGEAEKAYEAKLAAEAAAKEKAILAKAAAEKAYDAQTSYAGQASDYE